MTPQIETSVDNLIEIISLEYPKTNIDKLRLAISSAIELRTEIITPTLESICLDVADHFKINVDKMFVNRRFKEIVTPRQMAHTVSWFVLGNRPNGITGSIIAHEIGKKDHSTIINSIKSICNLMQTNRLFYNENKFFIYKYGIYKEVMEYNN